MTTGDKVLLIDDEEQFLEVLKRRLEVRGLRVDTAPEGRTALELASEHNYDVVILDLAMPGIDGIETLRRLRAANPDIQVVLLTGHATVPKGVEAMKLGAVDVLEKPADIGTLLDRINVASSRKQKLDEGHVEDQLAEILRKKGW